jgi:hypothetical protein
MLMGADQWARTTCLAAAGALRRLHPDTQREMTAQKSEWWHQAQAAYEAGDLEQLEVILTLCEIGDSASIS